MALRNLSQERETVGVFGAGKFGIAIANVLSYNRQVLLYTRNQDLTQAGNELKEIKGQALKENVVLTSDLESLPGKCRLLFIIIPSEHVAQLMRQLHPYLRPYHIIIHGTKGLHIASDEDTFSLNKLRRDQVKTMSELIAGESSVVRIGCIAGPNLAAEIVQDHPSATVVASRFSEVIKEGQAALKTPWFRVHGSHDLVGIELAGILKNVMAIAAGMMRGLGYGNNTHGMLLTNGLAEMATLGKALGANPRAFLGLAGIGDLIATCAGESSRNYTVGYRLALGDPLPEILDSMDETAEGVKTIMIVNALAQHLGLYVPITHVLSRVLTGKMNIQRGVKYLMALPLTDDVEFI